VPGNPDFDVVIAGGGIGGVICLKYAKDAGLKAVLLEARERVGGIWRDLPSWQDIQFRKEDWTLGDLPLAGEDQASILRNIESWVERFGLAQDIRLDSRVREARPQDGGWRVRTDRDEFRGRYLIAATGGHNRPVVPAVEREGSTIAEFHSSALRDPQLLAGKRVAVVGGGASAYDLLDLCFVQGASRVIWIYRSTKWMRPTRQAKYFGTDMRLLARYQMLGLSVDTINRLATRDLEARYRRAGIASIKPEGGFDLRRDQFIPGRRRMIQDFARIEQHRGEVRSLHGNTASLSDGTQVDVDVLLWGTGYATDLDYLGIPALSRAKLPEISARCRSVFLSTDAPNLFLLAPGILETSTATPWAYAHAAKSIMSHIAGRPVFVEPPRAAHTNHYDLVKLFARHDRANYPRFFWYLKYLWLALRHPKSRPMPIP